MTDRLIFWVIFIIVMSFMIVNESGRIDLSSRVRKLERLERLECELIDHTHVYSDGRVRYESTL